MMMSLDQFVFSLSTAPYKELQRQRNWKHRTSSRVGVRDASQYTGAGDDTITLNGTVVPAESFGSIASIKQLATMADAGDAYVLVDGAGNVYGAYIIDGLNETQTFHTAEGAPKKIEFTLTLKRVADETLAVTADSDKTQSEAKQLLTQAGAVAKVGTQVVDNVKNLKLSNVKSAAITAAVTVAPDVAEATVKGLSTASGISLDKALKAAKTISSDTGEAVNTVVAYVLEKTGGA